MNRLKILKLSVALVLALAVGLGVFHKKLISLVVLPQYIEWAAGMEEAGLRAGQALDEQPLAIARELGIKNPEKVRIIVVDEVPFPHDKLLLKLVGEALGFVGEGIVNNAQVFGYSIYVRKGYELNTPRLAHELVHVQQIERSSLKQVITQHFSDLATYGYEKSPLEVEAFKANQKYELR